MKKIYNILAAYFLLTSTTSCLHSNLDELENTSTVNEKIQNGRAADGSSQDYVLKTIKSF